MIKVNQQSPAQSVQQNVEKIQDDIRTARPEHGWQETAPARGGALRRLFRTLFTPLRALLRKLSPQRAARQETASSQFAATVARGGVSTSEAPASGQFTSTFLRGETIENRETFHAQYPQPYPPRWLALGKPFCQRRGVGFSSDLDAKPHGGDL